MTTSIARRSLARRLADADIVQTDEALWTENGWPSAGRMAAMMALLRAHHASVLAARRILHSARIGILDHSALTRIREAGENGETLAKLADRLLISPTRCTGIIDRLESEGWARRTGHPTDGRSTLCVITEEGKAKHDYVMGLLASKGWGFGNATDETLRELVIILRRVELERD